MAGTNPAARYGRRSKFPPGLRCGGTEMPASARRAAFVAAGLFAMVSLVSSAGAVAPPARLHGPAAELFSKVRVVCETRQEGKNVRTFFCNDGQTCVNAA